MKLVLVVIAVTLSAALAGAQTHVSQPITADTLKRMEAEFMHAAAARGSQGYMSYYAEDSVEVPNGADFLIGKGAIAKTMGFLDDQNNSLTWTPIGADVSGDLGYTYGSFEFRSRDASGKTTINHGKYTSIWKRQSDGSWKVVLDMGNATRSETVPQ
jgi:ketosteroid isomerase-like protein